MCQDEQHAARRIFEWLWRATLKTRLMPDRLLKSLRCLLLPSCPGLGHCPVLTGWRQGGRRSEPQAASWLARGLEGSQAPAGHHLQALWLARRASAHLSPCCMQVPKAGGATAATWHGKQLPRPPSECMASLRPGEARCWRWWSWGLARHAARRWASASMCRALQWLCAAIRAPQTTHACKRWPFSSAPFCIVGWQKGGRGAHCWRRQAGGHAKSNDK